jgi:hypothetical protein
MIKSFVGIFLSIFCFSATHAQYFYKDIVTSQQLQTDMTAYKNNKVRSINIKSFEGDGLESEGFFAQKKINKDYNRTELFTRSNISAPSLLITDFNNKGQISRIHDSSTISVTNNNYTYNSNGDLQSVRSSIRSSDDDFTTELVEEHIYIYDDNGKLSKMQRVKNRRDTVLILFAYDEKGNLSIEKDTRTGSKYYYYYDAKNRITDIVQENDLKLRPFPDYLFEYNNSQGLVSQMIATEEGGNNYYVWKYMYENGLRIAEKCFTKERKLMGRIEYEYK